MSEKIKTGNRGEDLAVDFLQSKGYEIVARNYRHRHSEIDLIVTREDWLLFVEVKTRTSSSHGEPEQFITMKQVKKLYEAAEEYIYSHDWHGHVRFDVVAVKLGEQTEIMHFEDAIN